MKKKNAVMLADTRTALVGTVLLQLQETNPGLFDEAIIYYLDPIPPKDQELMLSIMPCRFLPYSLSLPEDVMKLPRFQRFSKLMFCRYEMFSFLKEFETVTWLDTDILIQGDLSPMIDSAKKTGAVMIREDPINKTAANPDYMRTCFTCAVPGYQMDKYLYCSGTIVLSRAIKGVENCTKWCYEKTVQWADILSLPDQGVLNAAIQEFKINVLPISGEKYCCYPYLGRDCSKADIIHAWGSNKFWNDWYVYLNFPAWKEYYQQWCSLGGSTLPFEIRPRISVLIPSYKPNLKWMKECLDSLMGQQRDGWERFSDFEIIIIAEPVETEGIQELVESYHDLRIRLEINECRLGIAASLNRGMHMAEGKYIARVDDDDCCAPERLFLQMEYLEGHPAISLCTCDFEYFGDMNEWRLSFEGDMSFAWSIFTCPFDHPTIMLRKDFFFENNLFYDEDRGYVEDWELWRRAFEKGMRVGCIHKVLFYHRWMNTGSAGQTSKTVEMMRELVQKNFQQLGVNIPAEDLPLIAPWNGRLEDETDIQKLEGYFACALEGNRRKRMYNQSSLEKAFELRMEEARTGQLASLSKPIQRQTEKGEASGGTAMPPVMNCPQKASLIKRILKKLLKPIYRPFRHRYEERVIAIQESGWAIEGHVLNCISKLDQIIAMQQQQIDQMQQELADVRQELTKNVFAEAENTRQKIMDVQLELTKNVVVEAENTRQKIMDVQLELTKNVVVEVENTRQELSAKIYAETESIREKEKQFFDIVMGRMDTVGDHLYDVKQELRFQQGLALTELTGRPRIFLIGTPEHSNIGDAAITIGERAFFHRFFPESNIIELSAYDFDQWYGKIINMIEADDWIFLQGGGNLGNRFLQEERVRRRVISDLPSNRIIVMPQTIYFDDNEAGRRELALSQEIYNRHEHLTICTRGLQSMAFAKEHFGNARIINSLDMALMLSCKFNRARNGALLCLRNLDDESGLDPASYNQVVKTVKKRFPDCLMTNNLNKGDIEANIFRDMRRTVVTAELEKFASSKVVVTDRLHGLIFAVITHTPCVVLSAFNQKIEEFSQFFRDSDGVLFIGRDLSRLEESVEQALKVDKVVYPILANDYFKKLYHEIIGRESNSLFS